MLLQTWAYKYLSPHINQIEIHIFLNIFYVTFPSSFLKN